MRDQTFHILLQTTPLPGLQGQGAGLIGLAEIVDVDPVAWRWQSSRARLQHGRDLRQGAAPFLVADKNIGHYSAKKNN